MLRFARDPFLFWLRPGMRLNQIRFRIGHAILGDEALALCMQKTPLVSGHAVIQDGLGFSVDLRPLIEWNCWLPSQTTHRRR